jgi:hypothetical protein
MTNNRETLMENLRLARKKFREHPTEANARECERLYLLCYPDQAKRLVPDPK